MRIGKRTLKTALAILITIFIFIIFKAFELIPGVPADFSYKWYNPFFGALAACYSLQDSKEKSLSQAKNRCIASVIGGTIGIILIHIYSICGGDWPALATVKLTSFNYIIPYLLVSIFSVFVITIGNILNQRAAIFVALLTFLSVTINPGTIVPNWEFQFGINRILSTIIGVLVALGINFMKIPTFKNKKDTISIINLDDILHVKKPVIMNYLKYHLNNLKEEDIDFTFYTKDAPAIFYNKVENFALEKPIIALNNACLYSIDKKEYYDIKLIDDNISLKIIDYCNKHNINPFVNKIIHNVHYIFNSHIDNYHEQIYEDYVKNLSYLNYVIDYPKDFNNILYFTIFEEEKILTKLYDTFKDNKEISLIYELKNINNKEIKCLRIFSSKIVDTSSHRVYINDKLYYVNMPVYFDYLSINKQHNLYKKEFKKIRKLYLKGE